MYSSQDTSVTKYKTVSMYNNWSEESDLELCYAVYSRDDKYIC